MVSPLRSILFLIAGHVGFALTTAALAQTRPSAPDATIGRAGKLTFESVTPPGFFSLLRREPMPKTTVFGTLTLPKMDRAVPAMVIAHGSGGVSERERQWTARLIGLGTAAFVVDSFTPRGIKSTATDQSQLSTAANLADALAALKLMAAHPRIDPRRIGIIGFSKGGQVTLYAALEPYRRAVIDDERTRFALHIALYPPCSDWHQAQRISDRPMLLLLGGKDDYTPAAPCRDYAQWFAGKGAAVTVTTYPQAHHGFDTAGAAAYRQGFVSARDCMSTVDIDRFTVTARATGADITRTVRDYYRGCIKRGATFGGNREARQRVQQDVSDFVKRVLAP